MILLFRLSIPLYQPTFGKYHVLHKIAYIYLGIAAQYNNNRQFTFWLHSH